MQNKDNNNKVKQDVQKLQTDSNEKDQASHTDTQLNSEVTQLEKKKEVLRSKRSTLLIILSLLNIILFVSLIYFVYRINELPNQMETGDQQASQIVDEDVLRSQLASNEQRISSIENFIIDETGLVDFVQDLDQMRDEGYIDNFSFVSNQKITDKTSSSGYAIRITVSGDTAKIINAVQKIQELPYLFRSVNFDITKNQDENLFFMDYGIILYIDG